MNIQPGPFGRCRDLQTDSTYTRGTCRVPGLTRELRIRNIRFTCDLPSPLTRACVDSLRPPFLRELQTARGKGNDPAERKIA